MAPKTLTQAEAWAAKNNIASPLYAWDGLQYTVMSSEEWEAEARAYHAKKRQMLAAALSAGRIPQDKPVAILSSDEIALGWQHDQGAD